MSNWPANVPHVHANRLAAKDPDDKGSLFIARLDADRVQIIAREAGKSEESRVCIPFGVWLKLIENHICGITDGKTITIPRAEYEALTEALGESLKLQSHYAALLNQYDGGKRLIFRNVDEWLARLAALRAAGIQTEGGES